MATVKSYTDLQQSKKLAEILPLESADMYWWSSGKRYYIEAMDDGDFNEKEGHVRAWSLAALRNLLPPAIKPNKDSYLFESHNTFDNSWVYRYYNEDGVSYLYYKNINEVDACYEMILELKELNLV